MAGPANAAARSPNSHGRPRHPRPTTTPSQPVSRIMRSASSASQMSPLPSTGISRTRRFSAAIAAQRPRRRRAARRCARAARPQPTPSSSRDAARVEEGQVLLVDADAELDRDRHRAAAARTAARTIASNSSRLPRQRRPAALARDLAHRAAEVHVDVVDAVVADQPSVRRSRRRLGRRRRAAGCAASRRARSREHAASSRCPRPAPRAVIISLTYSPRRSAGTAPKRVLVTPAIGASTTGGSAITLSDKRIIRASPAVPNTAL